MKYKKIELSMRLHTKRMKRVAAWILTICMLLSCFISYDVVNAEEVEITSPSCILMEASTGTIIYEKNADEKLKPASVTKVMTLLLAFEAIANGKMTLEDTVTISEHAASMEGSRCFFEAGEQQTVEDIIKCIIIASGNDTAVAMGEHLAGSEQAFVEMMNARAAELGMTNTHFENACGLDAKGHVTTSRDIAIMTRELTVNHPKIFEYSTIWMDSITHVTRRGSKEFTLANTNKFLRQYNGATGLKTGYTSVARYSISATATRDGVDLIAVVMGSETKEIRNEEAGKLMDYGFAKCQIYKDDNPFQEVNDIPVAGGKKTMVKCKKEGSFSYVFTNGEDLKAVEKKVALLELKAPIKAGDVIGSVNYTYQGNSVGAVDILAEEDIEKVDFLYCFTKVLYRFMALEMQG